MKTIQRAKTGLGFHITGLALAFLAAAGCSAPAWAAGEVSVAATLVSQDGPLSAKEDPAGLVWSRVPEQTVELNLAPPVHPSIVLLQENAGKVTAPLLLKVSAIRDAKRIYFRLRWSDQTRDDQRKMGAFQDGVAVEIPLSQSETNPMMGQPDRPVSIWRWNAAGNGVEALLAASPGTLSNGHSETLRGKGLYKVVDDPARREWLVVISQDLDASDDGMDKIRARRSFPAAFAVWQGSERQRGGYKMVSGWVSVSLAAEH